MTAKPIELYKELKDIHGIENLLKKLSEIINNRIEEKTPKGGRLFIGNIADAAGVNVLTLRRVLSGNYPNAKLSTVKNIFRALDLDLIITEKFDCKIVEVGSEEWIKNELKK